MALGFVFNLFGFPLFKNRSCVD